MEDVERSIFDLSYCVKHGAVFVYASCLFIGVNLGVDPYGHEAYIG